MSTVVTGRRPREVVSVAWVGLLAIVAVAACRRLAIPWPWMPFVLAWPPFSEGIFEVLQARSASNGRTTLELKGSNFRNCEASGGGANAARLLAAAVGVHDDHDALSWNWVRSTGLSSE